MSETTFYDEKRKRKNDVPVFPEGHAEEGVVEGDGAEGLDELDGDEGREGHGLCVGLEGRIVSEGEGTVVVEGHVRGGDEGVELLPGLDAGVAGGPVREALELDAVLGVVVEEDLYGREAHVRARERVARQEPGREDGVRDLAGRLI